MSPKFKAYAALRLFATALDICFLRWLTNRSVRAIELALLHS